jgi:hypothetical protein
LGAREHLAQVGRAALGLGGLDDVDGFGRAALALGLSGTADVDLDAGWRCCSGWRQWRLGGSARWRRRGSGRLRRRGLGRSWRRQAEVDSQQYARGDWLAVSARGLEVILRHGLFGRLVEAVARGLDRLGRLHLALRADQDAQQHRGFDQAGVACFVGEGRGRRFEQRRCCSLWLRAGRFGRRALRASLGGSLRQGRAR